MSPRPLWDALRGRPDSLSVRRPVILRFATDQFMEEAQAVLAGTAGPLADRVARPETWQAPAAGLDPAPGSIGQAGLKLYQPVHQRFYLVAAALTCRLPGLPDHTVAAGEETGYVVRRVVPLSAQGDVSDPTRRQEYAWIGSNEGHWLPVTSSSLTPGEERLPLFPMIYQEVGRKRRMLAGLVPVSRRQTYVSGREQRPAGPGTAPSVGADPLDDPRGVEFQRRVIDPWADLLDWFDNRLDAAQRSLATTTASIEQSSALILLDFANFLKNEATVVWEAIDGGTPPPSGPSRVLFDALSVVVTDHRPGAPSIPLRDAIAAVLQNEAALEAATLGQTGPADLPAGCPRLQPQGRMVDLGDFRALVAMAHSENTSKKTFSGTRWQHCRDFGAAEMLGDDRDRYARLLR